MKNYQVMALLVIYSKATPDTPQGATPPGCHTPYMPHPLHIVMSNIYSHVKSQVPSMKNDRVMALSVIYSKATPTGCHTP